MEEDTNLVSSDLGGRYLWDDIWFKSANGHLLVDLVKQYQACSGSPEEGHPALMNPPATGACRRRVTSMNMKLR